MGGIINNIMKKIIIPLLIFLVIFTTNISKAQNDTQKVPFCGDGVISEGESVNACPKDDLNRPACNLGEYVSRYDSYGNPIGIDHYIYYKVGETCSNGQVCSIFGFNVCIDRDRFSPPVFTVYTPKVKSEEQIKIRLEDESRFVNTRVTSDAYLVKLESGGKKYLT